ncbi:MAG TPA: glucose 1-dehydrogenase [Chloroflexia bacterium]|nr:glucose 1-dehydrogenase [Chloroflexia bacterium]
MSYPDLKGKVAVITGAGTGIGRAAALALAREGVSIAVVDWHEEAGWATVGEIERLASQSLSGEEITPGKAIFIQADVSRLVDARRIAEKTIQAFGQIDILHNNAGIQTYGTVVDMDEETWDKTLNVNLKSIFLVSKFVIPHIITAGGGSVINTASIQSHACLPNAAAYVASKGGVLALTREMALDFGKDHVRVNAILPGSINTPMLQFAASQEQEPDKAFEEWGKVYPLGRIGTPEEVAALVVFLASNISSFVTGSPFFVDGGIAAQLFK